MPSETSATIYRAFDFTRRIGTELEALFDEIESGLGDAFKNTPWSVSYVKRQKEYANDPSGWICEGWLKEFDVKEKRRGDIMPKSVGVLSYIFDLAIQGARSEVLSKSLITVAWGGAGDKEFEITFPDDLKKWERSSWSSTQGERLLIYEGSKKNLTDLKNTCWFFALPLAEIHNQHEVRQFLADPVIALFEGRSETVFEKIPTLSLLDLDP